MSKQKMKTPEDDTDDLEAEEQIEEIPPGPEPEPEPVPEGPKQDATGPWGRDHTWYAEQGLTNSVI